MGFARLFDAMHEHFPSIPAGWYRDVMLPPFATNERVLFRRAEGIGGDLQTRHDTWRRRVDRVSIRSRGRGNVLLPRYRKPATRGPED